jgi:hypothetical protein
MKTRTHIGAAGTQTGTIHYSGVNFVARAWSSRSQALSPVASSHRETAQNPPATRGFRIHPSVSVRKPLDRNTTLVLVLQDMSCGAMRRAPLHSAEVPHPQGADILGREEYSAFLLTKACPTPAGRCKAFSIANGLSPSSGAEQGCVTPVTRSSKKLPHREPVVEIRENPAISWRFFGQNPSIPWKNHPRISCIFIWRYTASLG